MKKAKAYLAFDHSHPNRDGRIPVVIRVYSPAHKRNRDYVTGEMADPDEVDAYEFGSLSTSALNEAKKVIDRMYANDVPFDWQVFEGQFLQRSSGTTINRVLRDKIASLRMANKSTTSHRDLERELERFRGENIPLTSINRTFIRKFIEMLSQSNSENSIRMYLRTLRARLNDAKRDGLLHKTFEDPMEGMDLKSKPSFKRHLTREELELLVSYSDEIPRSRSRDSQHMFHLSYLCRGMNPVDMFMLKWSDVHTDAISYFRTKTKGIFKIKITPKIREILNYFKEKYPDSTYILPVFWEDMDMSKENVERVTKNMCRTIAKNMRRIAKIVGVPHEEEINAYTARHTFAAHYLMYDKTPSIYKLMQYMGHSSEQATRFYIASLRIDLSEELEWM